MLALAHAEYHLHYQKTPLEKLLGVLQQPEPNQDELAELIGQINPHTYRNQTNLHQALRLALKKQLFTIAIKLLHDNLLTAENLAVFLDVITASEDRDTQTEQKSILLAFMANKHLMAYRGRNLESLLHIFVQRQLHYLLDYMLGMSSISTIDSLHSSVAPAYRSMTSLPRPRRPGSFAPPLSGLPALNSDDTTEEKLIEIDAVDICGWSAFHYAAYLGDLRSMTLLKKEGANINLEISNYPQKPYPDAGFPRVALHIIVQGYLAKKMGRDKLEAFLAFQPNLDIPEWRQELPQLQQQDDSAASTTTTTQAPATKPKKRMTALTRVIAADDAATYSLLVTHHAVTTYDDESILEPLVAAAKTNPNSTIFGDLLAYYRNDSVLLAQDDDKNNSIDLCLEQQCDDKALAIVDNIDVQHRGPDDMTALQHAAQRGQQPVVERLLALGANANQPFEIIVAGTGTLVEGFSLLMLAVQSGNAKLIDYLVTIIGIDFDYQTLNRPRHSNLLNHQQKQQTVVHYAISILEAKDYFKRPVREIKDYQRIITTLIKHAPLSCLTRKDYKGRTVADKLLQRRRIANQANLADWRTLHDTIGRRLQQGSTPALSPPSSKDATPEPSPASSMRRLSSSSVGSTFSSSSDDHSDRGGRTTRDEQLLSPIKKRRPVIAREDIADGNDIFQLIRDNRPVVHQAGSETSAHQQIQILLDPLTATARNLTRRIDQTIDTQTPYGAMNVLEYTVFCGNADAADIVIKQAIQFRPQPGLLTNNNRLYQIAADAEIPTVSVLAVIRKHFPTLSVEDTDIRHREPPALMVLKNRCADNETKQAMAQWFIEHGTRIDVAIGSSREPLTLTDYLLHYNAFQVLEWLAGKRRVVLNFGPNTLLLKISNAPPLVRAAAHQARQTLKIILAHSPIKQLIDVNQQDQTALHIAIEIADLATVKLLVAHAQKHGYLANLFKVTDKLCRTPMMVAFRQGTITIINYLLQYEQDLTLFDTDFQTILHYMVLNDQAEQVTWLATTLPALFKILVIKKDKYDQTPLHVAVLSASTPTTEVLIKHAQTALDEADMLSWLNAQDKAGDAAMHLAATQPDPAKLVCLSAHGANLNCYNTLLQNPLTRALCSSNTPVYDQLLVYYLDEQTDHTAELVTVDTTRMSAVDYFVARRDYARVHKLLAAKKSLIDPKHPVPLIECVRNSDEKMWGLLDAHCYQQRIQITWSEMLFHDPDPLLLLAIRGTSRVLLELCCAQVPATIEGLAVYLIRENKPTSWLIALLTNPLFAAEQYQSTDQFSPTILHAICGMQDIDESQLVEPLTLLKDHFLKIPDNDEQSWKKLVITMNCLSISPIAFAHQRKRLQILAWLLGSLGYQADLSMQYACENSDRRFIHQYLASAPKLTEIRASGCCDLYYLARHGMVAEFATVIAFDLIDVNTLISADRETAITIAHRYQHMSDIQFWLSFNRDKAITKQVNIFVLSQGACSLHYAAEQEDPGQLTALITLVQVQAAHTHINFHPYDTNHDTPLVRAAAKGTIKTVDILQQLGCTPIQLTKAIVAAHTNGHSETVNMLISIALTPDDAGKTVLHHLAAGNAELMQAFITVIDDEHINVDFSAVDRQKKTPLMIAAEMHHAKNVPLIYANIPTMQRKVAVTAALHIALSYTRENTIEARESVVTFLWGELQTLIPVTELDETLAFCTSYSRSVSSSSIISSSSPLRTTLPVREQQKTLRALLQAGGFLAQTTDQKKFE